MTWLLRPAFLFFLIAAALAGWPKSAAAEEESAAVFALVIGVNRSVDADQQPLRYADDDAALYFTLFRALGARTYLLTRPDDNTRRLHPQAVAESALPQKASFTEAIAKLAADVFQARANKVRTVFYFVYAGHGNVRDGRGYIALEDQRLTGQEIVRAIEQIAADKAHVIIDACYSFYLAYDRGPGGRTRPFVGLRSLGTMAEHHEIGLLLSTASARESHEWEGFQAGVFSHEVRSGLFGAADADGDGQVSYREIAAFIERANAAIPNERFRPDVYARPPQSTELLIDLRPALTRHVELPPAQHYLLESAQGVRVAEVHNALGHPSYLLRPMLLQPLYVEKLDPVEEYRLPAAPDVVSLAALSPQPLRAHERGAAHEAFSTIFSLPFLPETVAEFRFRPLPTESSFYRLERRQYRQKIAALTTLLLSSGALVSGVTLSLSAFSLHSASISGLSQLQVDERNQQVAAQNLTAGVLYGVSGALFLTGGLLWLLPRLPGRLSVSVSGSGGTMLLNGGF